MLTYSSVPGPLRQFSWERHPLQRGKAVFRESDPAGHIYLLETGLVKLSRDLDSHRKMIIRLVHPGEMIGNRSLGAGGRQRYTAEALSDGSVCGSAIWTFSSAATPLQPRSTGWPDRSNNAWPTSNVGSNQSYMHAWKYGFCPCWLNWRKPLSGLKACLLKVFLSRCRSLRSLN